MKRILVAGLGNILRRDDGFGVRVVERLARLALPRGVELYEAGGAGIGLVQKLMDGFDVCILVDAVRRGGAPGTLYFLDPAIPQQQREVGMHELEPAQILLLARASGALPGTVRLIGCEPGETEELGVGLSPVVEGVVEKAVRQVLAEIERLTG